MATPIPTNSVEFSLTDVLTAVGGTLHGSCDANATFVGVSTDTRNNTAGSVFVALRGERFDAHTFASQAVERGAALLIVEKVLPVAVPQVLVPDTLNALGALAAWHRQRWGGKVLAIAGAAGKTTTRCVTSALMTSLVGDQVHSTIGNLNNRVGVPMVLLGLRPHHRFAVVEVGTNQLGEVPTLVAIVKPDVSVLTLVDLEHTEGLLSLDAIEQEEGAIFSPSCRSLVANGDDERAVRQASLAAVRNKGAIGSPQVFTYGTQSPSTLQLLNRVTENAHASNLTLRRHAGDVGHVNVGLVGLPAAYAVMAACLAVEALLERTLSWQELQSGLLREELKPEGRAEMVEGPHGVLIINDSYNANPASMQRALETATELAHMRAGRLHLVLGEMRELGELSRSAHQTLAERVNAFPWTSVFAIGREMLPFIDTVAPRASDCVVRHGFDTTGIATQLRQLLGPNDVVLVKGSRGVRTERVIAELVEGNLE